MIGPVELSKRHFLKSFFFVCKDDSNSLGVNSSHLNRIRLKALSFILYQSITEEKTNPSCTTIKGMWVGGGNKYRMVAKKELPNFLPLFKQLSTLYCTRKVKSVLLNLGDDGSVLERRHDWLGAHKSGSSVLRRKSSMDFFCCLCGTWGGEIGIGDIACPDVGVPAVVLPDGKREEEDIGNHNY